MHSWYSVQSGSLVCELLRHWYIAGCIFRSICQEDTVWLCALDSELPAVMLSWCMKCMQTYKVLLFAVTQIALLFGLAFPLWSGLRSRLIEAFKQQTACIHSLPSGYTASATWQCEIIFTHRQLWLSGLRSAKKRSTQMAREREHGGWFLRLSFRGPRQ